MVKGYHGIITIDRQRIEQVSTFQDISNRSFGVTEDRIKVQLGKAAKLKKEKNCMQCMFTKRKNKDLKKRILKNVRLELLPINRLIDFILVFFSAIDYF